MTTEWSVFVNRRGDVALAGDADQAIEQFTDYLAEHHGGGAADTDHYSAQLSVDAADPAEAVHWAVEITRKCAAGAGLPDWPVVQADAVRADELDRQLDMPNFPELVGVSEIAEILAVSRQRASRVTMRDDFPEPVAELASGPVWTRPSLNRFVEGWPRQPGRPAKEHAP